MKIKKYIFLYLILSICTINLIAKRYIDKYSGDVYYSKLTDPNSDLVEFVRIRGEKVRVYEDLEDFEVKRSLPNKLFVQLIEIDDKYSFVRIPNVEEGYYEGWVKNLRILKKKNKEFRIFYGKPLMLIEDQIEQNPAWVVADSTFFYTRPKEDSNILGTFYFGQEIFIQKEYKNYYEIKIYDDSNDDYLDGYLKLNSVTKNENLVNLEEEVETEEFVTSDTLTTKEKQKFIEDLNAKKAKLLAEKKAEEEKLLTKMLQETVDNEKSYYIEKLLALKKRSTHVESTIKTLNDSLLLSQEKITYLEKIFNDKSQILTQENDFISKLNKDKAIVSKFSKQMQEYNKTKQNYTFKLDSLNNILAKLTDKKNNLNSNISNFNNKISKNKNTINSEKKLLPKIYSQKDKFISEEKTNSEIDSLKLILKNLTVKNNTKEKKINNNKQKLYTLNETQDDFKNKLTLLNDDLDSEKYIILSLKQKNLEKNLNLSIGKLTQSLRTEKLKSTETENKLSVLNNFKKIEVSKISNFKLEIKNKKNDLSNLQKSIINLKAKKLAIEKEESELKKQELAYKNKKLRNKVSALRLQKRILNKINFGISSNNDNLNRQNNKIENLESAHSLKKKTIKIEKENIASLITKQKTYTKNLKQQKQQKQKEEILAKKIIIKSKKLESLNNAFENTKKSISENDFIVKKLEKRIINYNKSITDKQKQISFHESKIKQIEKSKNEISKQQKNKLSTNEKELRILKQKLAAINQNLTSEKKGHTTIAANLQRYIEKLGNKQKDKLKLEISLTKYKKEYDKEISATKSIKEKTKQLNNKLENLTQQISKVKSNLLIENDNLKELTQSITKYNNNLFAKKADNDYEKNNLKILTENKSEFEKKNLALKKEMSELEEANANLNKKANSSKKTGEKRVFKKSKKRVKFVKKTGSKRTKKHKVDLKGWTRSPSVIVYYTEKKRPAMLGIFKKAKSKDNNFQGKFMLKFTITPKGKTKKVRVTNTKFSNKKVGAFVKKEVEKRVRKWRFPPDNNPNPAKRVDKKYRLNYNF